MLHLQIDVPVASFRPYEARDYQETYPAPPPATVFGMLLSLCGIEGDEVRHFAGCRLAIAVNHSEPPSKILRRMRRDPKSGEMRIDYRPEYQELLLDLTVWCNLTKGENSSGMGLGRRVSEALERPDTVERYGGLSLGESCFLVDAVRQVEAPLNHCFVLRPAEYGSYALPIWVDFKNRTQTVLRRFDLVEGTLEESDLVEITPEA